MSKKPEYPKYDGPTRVRTLGQMQRAFAWCAAQLVLEVYRRGWSVSIGDVFRDARVHGAFGTKKRGSYAASKSVHKLKLAIDLNLFTPDAGGTPRYRSKTSDHLELGEWWKGLGEANGLDLRWGGDFTRADGNHYSMAYKGAA